MSAPGAGSAFGVHRRRTIGEPDLAPVRQRLARATRRARELEDAVAAWRAKTTFTSHVTVSDTAPSTLEVVVETSRLFPHDHWSSLAGEFAYQARTTLDNLNDNLARSFAEHPYDATRIQFPITSTGKDWRTWKQRHRFYPEWLIEKFDRVQPKTGRYKALEGLQWFNNKDKHEWMRDLEVAMTGLVAGSTFVLEGLLGEHDVTPILTAGKNVIERGARRVVVGTFDVGHPILEAPPIADNAVEVDLLFDVGTGAYSLDEIRELPVRIGYIIDYLARDDSRAFVLYQSRPAYISPDAGATELRDPA